MQVMAVDDERISLELMMRAIYAYDEDISFHTFRDPYNALEFAKMQKIDVAFVDVSMDGMTGVELAEKLIEVYPAINIIFTTGYSQYMADAFEMHASGYIMKPITAEKVRHELEHLRNPVDGTASAKKVKIRCFGNFELYVNGQVPNYKYSRTREFLAYLVDRKGSSCSSAEISAVLWNDDANHDSYLRNIRKDLIDTLTAAGVPDLIRSVNGRTNIQIEQVDCDYYNWLRDHSTAKYTGEYMSQYSWAEETNAYIYRQENRG